MSTINRWNVGQRPMIDVELTTGVTHFCHQPILTFLPFWRIEVGWNGSCKEIKHRDTVIEFYFVLIRFDLGRQRFFVGISNVTYSSGCIACFGVSGCPSISCDNKATEWAGEEASITMNVHLVPCLKNLLAEVLWTLHAPFQGRVRVFDMAIEIEYLGEALCTDRTLKISLLLLWGTCTIPVHRATAKVVVTTKILNHINAHLFISRPPPFVRILFTFGSGASLWLWSEGHSWVHPFLQPLHSPTSLSSVATAVEVCPAISASHLQKKVNHWSVSKTLNDYLLIFCPSGWHSFPPFWAERRSRPSPRSSEFASAVTAFLFPQSVWLENFLNLL